MASVVTLPSAPNTGLSSLASVLLSSSADYANQKRADSVDARRRAQRLEDITAERLYAERQYDRARDDRLSDISSERSYKDAVREVEREERLGDIRDERYWTEKLRNQGADEAQAALNQLGSDRAAVMGRMGELEKRLSAPEPQPTREQVMSRALAIARQTTGKTTPPTAEIEASVPQAIEEARAVLNQSWQRDRLDAQEQQRINASMLNRISAEMNVITNVFRRVAVPQGSPTTTAPTQVESPKKDLATVQREFAESLRAELAKQRQGAPDAAPTSGPPADYTYQGGILGGVERAVPAVGAGLSRLAEIPGRFDRAAGAVGTGILTGDFSVPEVGGLATIGNAIGSHLVEANAESQRNIENNILQTEPYSLRAKEIRARRGMAQPPPAPVINLPQSARAPIIQLPTN